MTDFSQLENWHAADEDQELSPVLYVEGTLTTQTNESNPIYTLALNAFNTYAPVDDPQTTVISFKREDKDEIYQEGGTLGWEQPIKEAMNALKLTLKKEDDLDYLEDSQTFTIFANEDNEQLQIINWRVDHTSLNFVGEEVPSFLDTITWVYTSSSQESMEFSTQYIWKGYNPS